MDISQYIKEYDFSNFLEKFREEFKERISTKKYLNDNPEENFIKFSEQFWENPNSSVDILKDKYKISRQISYSDIIKAYPTNRYIELLKMYYSISDIEELIREFAIPNNRIEKIIIPIIIDDEESHCPNCFNNSFELESDTDATFIYKCEQCCRRLREADLLTSEQVQQEIQTITDKKIAYDEKIEGYEKILEDIKCPKCQEKLYLNKFSDFSSYQIKCKKCSYNSYSIEKTIDEFQAWKQRAAIMIAIKAKEQELIEKALESKKEKDVFFAKEDIIVSQENESTFEFLKESLVMDNIQIWSELLKRIRSCNRLEKKVLSEVIELTQNEGEQKILNLARKEVKLYAYMPEEPVVYNLISKTKIIVMRQILRRLMKQNFILVSEEQNYILIPEILIDNLESIKNLMVVKDINPNVRYLIMQRQNFTCMTCGETGRPLKIAYLTSDKNINDLNSMIALCDNCHQILTRNDILIDGTITFEVDGISKNKLISLEFLIIYHPELKNNENVIRTLQDWERDYSLTDVIKALTVTIDKIKKNKVEGTVNTLLSYTNAILRSTIETCNPINIYDSLKEQYELSKWIEDTLE